MLTREQLNTYLETYDQSISLRRLLNLNSWVTQFRDFVRKLDNDAPIDAVKLAELQGIVNKREPDAVNFRGELSAGAALAKKINDALHRKILVPLHADSSVEEVFPEHVSMMILDGLRPEQRAQLMTLNKRYHALLSDPSFWKSAVQKHFKLAFDKKKSLLGVNWLQVFGSSHRDEYQPLNQREKKLFSSIKSGDLTELTLLNLKSSDLHLVNRKSNPLWNYLSSDQPQALLDYIYRLINQDKKSTDDLTLNHWAVVCNQVEAVLPNVNVNANLADNFGRTLLYYAACKGHLEVVEALIAAGANVNAARNDSVTPLYIAAQQGHLSIVKALIAAGANVNAACNEGVTPLYIAAKNGHLAIVEALISVGVNVNAACNDGETLLDAAKREKHYDIVTLLSQKKLDIYIKEKSESNALSQHTMTLFGKTITKEQALSAAIALKVVTQGADKSILEEHRDALNQGDLKPLYENLTRKR